MPGKISDTSITEVRDKLDIVDLVSEYVTLKKSGRGHSGLCPFHNEKTPSFSVDGEKGLYYCFGCQEGGDAFDFYMKIERLDFAEAIERLSDRVGVRLQYEGGAGDGGSQRRRLLELAELAAKYYRWVLTDTKPGELGRQYLEGRGLTGDIAESFRLGMAPDGWSHLTDFARKKGYKESELISAGLALKGDHGLYDRFRNRVIFPISDKADRVMAFGGRVLDDSKPKYLNSSEGPIYSKGNHLYALNLARKDIATAGCAIICEGYTDVIALHQAGLGNTVASLGTALTEHQLRLLHKYTELAYLLYDGDAAGAAAAGRGLELAQATGMRIKVCQLPEGQDPADFAAAQGKAGIESLLKAALPVLEYRLTKAIAGHDKADPESVQAALDAAVEVLARVESPVVSEHYVSWLANELDLSESSTGYLIGKLNEKRRSAGAGASQVSAGGPSSRPAVMPATGSDRRLEEQLIGNLLATGWAELEALLDIGPTDMTDPVFADALRALANGDEPAAIIEAADGEDSKRLKGLLMTAAGGREECIQLALRLKERSLRRREVSLIKEIGESADNNKLELIRSLTSLSQERKALLKRMGHHIEKTTMGED